MEMDISELISAMQWHYARALRDMSDKLPFIQSKSCGPTTSDIRWITKRKFSEEDNYPIQG